MRNFKTENYQTGLGRVEGLVLVASPLSETESAGHTIYQYKTVQPRRNSTQSKVAEDAVMY